MSTRDHAVQSAFLTTERTAVDYFDAAVPHAETLYEEGEWYAQIEGRRFSLSALALAIAQALEK